MRNTCRASGGPSEAGRRRRPSPRQRGAALLVVVITMVVVGVLAAAMVSLLSTTTREQVMAGFTNDAFALSEAGARQVIAQVTNAFYNLSNPATPEAVMAGFGSCTTATSGGVKTITLDAPLELTLADAGRAVTVGDLRYTEVTDSATHVTSGQLHLAATGKVNTGSALAAAVRNVYDVETGKIPGPTTIFDFAVWAGDGGISMDGTPNGIDSVADAATYKPRAKSGSQVPVDPVTKLPDYTAPVYVTKTGTSVDLNGATIYGDVTAEGVVTPATKVLGDLHQNTPIAEDKAPVTDLGNGKDLVTYASQHSLAHSVDADGTFECTSGTLPGGIWRWDGDLLLNTTSGKPLRIDGDVTLFVGGDFSLAAQSAIEIISGRLSVIVSGTMTFGTGSEVNIGSTADKALFFGTPTCTSVTVKGCPNFVGAIYAPAARVTISGNSALLGAVCGYSVNMNGTSRMTFDNSLQSLTGGPYQTRYHAERTQHLRSLVVAGP